MEKLLILFLSCLFLSENCNGQTMSVKTTIDCYNKHTQDSLIERYIENGAQKLRHFYNDRAWPVYCDSIIALCPNIAEAYRQKAIPFIKNGEYEKAFELENKIVELEPKEWTAYNGFLKCIFTKDYEGAIIEFQKAQQLTPNGFEMDHTYFFYEGLCNLELGNYKKAEANFNQDVFIQIGGEAQKEAHFNTLLYFGILYYEMGDYTKAKEYLLNCLKQYSQLPDANYYLAMTYKKIGDLELKKKYLETAKLSIQQGYSMNEDNLYYANYPHQIKLYEIEEELKNGD